jgi:hypothetical protein
MPVWVILVLLLDAFAGQVWSTHKIGAAAKYREYDSHVKPPCYL